MRKRLGYLVIFLLIIGMISGCAKEKDSQSKKEVTLNIFIAASLKNAMEEIKTDYEQDNENINIVYNADSSGTLMTQIREGADCDVFFSAAMQQITELKDDGHIIKDSIKNILGNDVVIIKAKGIKTEVTGFENITKAKNIALAGEAVPAGIYARQIFKNLGIFDQVMSMEINEGANVTAVLTAVSEKSNEVGVVYATDAYSINDSVEVIAVASKDSLDEPIVYPVGLVKNVNGSDERKDEAEKFVNYLQSDKAMKIFEKYGFSNLE